MHNTNLRMMNRVTLEVQFQANSDPEPPSKSKFERWVGAALPEDGCYALVIRVVDNEESRALNYEYRKRDKPTNVLSFPMGVYDETEAYVLGDIVVCADLVAEEAAQQDKVAEAHWAHLTVHGVLHLLGFDHESAHQALEMETREVEILAGLGYQDPYQQ